MNKPVCTPPQLNFWIICALFMIVAVSPQLDLAVSAFFFRDNRFYLGDWGFFPFLRRGLPEIFIGIAAAFGLIWGWGLLRRRWLWGINTKVMLLTTGSMLLGPILIVNGIFKTFWGRARPYQIIEFGGNKNFTSPMVISNQCDWDCSFMSGHTAVIFWSLALALLLPHRYRKWGISAVIILGIATGIARIAQGSHFVSDVFFSATITYALILWLHFKLFPEQYCRRNLSVSVTVRSYLLKSCSAVTLRHIFSALLRPDLPVVLHPHYGKTNCHKKNTPCFFTEGVFQN